MDGNFLNSKALTFASKLSVDEFAFKASDGCLQNFKVRHSLPSLEFHGKSGVVNKGAVHKWKEHELKIHY